MFRNILFVCIGNICRSPLGEAYLKHQSYLNQLSLEVTSAGLGALVGHKVHPHAQTLLEEDGIDGSQHRARQIDMAMLKQADIIFVMERFHREEMIHRFPTVCGKVHLLGKWNNFEIFDPYKKSKHVFAEAYSLIKQGIHDWQKKIWN